MKDRLIGMMGTLGLALVMSSLLPAANAFAFGGSGGTKKCGGACGQAQPNGKCPPKSTVIGVYCAGGAAPNFCKCQDATAPCGCRI